MTEATTTPASALWGGQTWNKQAMADDPVYQWYSRHVEEFRAAGDLVEIDNPAGTAADKVGEVAGFQICRCPDTGFMFANPRLKTERLVEYFSSVDSNFYFEQVERSTEQRRKLSYEPLARFLSGHAAPGSRVLEIGCGSGALLETLRDQAKFEVEGLEIASGIEQYVERRKLLVHQAPIEEFHPEKPYDGAVMWSVMDHFTDPVLALKSTNAALVEGGFLCIGNINTDGLDHSVIGMDISTYKPPTRVNYYNPKSLTHQLELAGFEVIDISTPGKLDVEIVQEYWQSGGQNGRHPFLETIVASHGTDFQDFLIQNCLSGYMRVLAVKRSVS